MFPAIGYEDEIRRMLLSQQSFITIIKHSQSSVPNPGNSICTSFLFFQNFFLKKNTHTYMIQTYMMSQHQAQQKDRKRNRRQQLKALSVNNRRTRLVVFLFGDPHRLESGQGSQDGASNPHTVLALWRSNNLDLH